MSGWRPSDCTLAPLGLGLVRYRPRRNRRFLCRRHLSDLADVPLERCDRRLQLAEAGRLRFAEFLQALLKLIDASNKLAQHLLRLLPRRIQAHNAPRKQPSEDQEAE